MRGTPLNKPTELGMRIQQIMGPGGVFDHGVFLFAFINKDADTQIGWITVEDPTIAQTVGLLEVGKLAIFLNDGDSDEDDDDYSSTIEAL